jgi:hypothetical protein
MLWPLWVVLIAGSLHYVLFALPTVTHHAGRPV